MPYPKFQMPVALFFAEVGEPAMDREKSHSRGSRFVTPM